MYFLNLDFRVLTGNFGLPVDLGGYCVDGVHGLGVLYFCFCWLVCVVC